MGLEDKMEPEVLFLRCAFPCTEGKVHRNEITKEEFEQLYGAAIKGEVVDRGFLERVYNFAVMEMEGVAQELGKPLWDNKVVEEYFFVKHNEVIDEGRGPYANALSFQKEHCKVFDAEVVGEGEKTLIVEYNGTTRVVLNDFVPEAGIGSRVKIHQGYAVKLMDEKE